MASNFLMTYPTYLSVLVLNFGLLKPLLVLGLTLDLRG